MFDGGASGVPSASAWARLLHSLAPSCGRVLNLLRFSGSRQAPGWPLGTFAEGGAGLQSVVSPLPTAVACFLSVWELGFISACWGAPRSLRGVRGGMGLALGALGEPMNLAGGSLCGAFRGSWLASCCVQSAGKVSPLCRICSQSWRSHLSSLGATAGKWACPPHLL